MTVRLACALLLCPSLALPATVPQRGLEGYSRRIWQTQDGLPEEPVQALAQTPDGYLWFGTSGGLVRFDGAEMVVFNRENTPALRENSGGRLWVGGSSLLMLDGGRTVEYPLEGGSSARVKSILQTRGGVLWVGTVSGLERLNPDGTGRFNRMPEVSGTVRVLREDRDGVLWIGTIGEGIFFYGRAVLRG